MAGWPKYLPATTTSSPDGNRQQRTAQVSEKATNFLASTKTSDRKQATRGNEIEVRFNETDRKTQLHQTSM
jgi:hypothetical protein